MARALAGDASSRRGEKESELENGASSQSLSLQGLLASLGVNIVRSDSAMRKVIPGLAIVFIIVLALFRAGELADEFAETERTAQTTLSLMATVVSANLNAYQETLPEIGYRTTLKRILADSLPAGATSMSRVFLITDQSGTVVASAPILPDLEGRPITDIIGPSQPLTVFGARAGVLSVPADLGASDGAEQVLATVHHLNGGLGMVAALQPESAIYANWRDDLSANVTLFVGTSLVLLAVIYGFFSQASRAEHADDMYAATRARIDTALTHGLCGLFDWDLSRGRMFWSSSLYELLGREPKDDILSFADVADLTHPDDIDLLGLAEHLLESGETLVDETFRMRHADGSWIWLRARGEIQSEPGRAEPHLIGICIDITEQH